MKQALWSIGLMSGTSMDGVDAAAILTNGTEILDFGPMAYVPYPDDLRAQIRGVLGRWDYDAEVSGVAQALTKLHVQAAQDVQTALGGKAAVVGFHGQTIAHAPCQRTLQIGDPQMLRNALDIPVVYDFRTADIDAGGQGAPILPIYHQLLVRRAQFDGATIVLNIGGVSNLTWVGPVGQDLIAFDCGPGNALIDDAMQILYGQRHDTDGAMARTGQIDQAKVVQLLADPYFQQPYPKSLDRDYFTGRLVPRDANDVATLTAFTVQAIAWAVHQLPKAAQVVVCGGGQHNVYMLQLLRQALPQQHVVRADDVGWRADFIEAEGMALLAVRYLYDMPSTWPTTTGCGHPAVLGKIVH